MQCLVRIKTRTAVAMKMMMMMMMMVTMMMTAALLLPHQGDTTRGSAPRIARTAGQTPLREDALSAVAMDGYHGRRAWQQPRCVLTCALSALTPTDGGIAPLPALGADEGDAA